MTTEQPMTSQQFLGVSRQPPLCDALGGGGGGGKGSANVHNKRKKGGRRRGVNNNKKKKKTKLKERIPCKEDNI